MKKFIALMAAAVFVITAIPAKPAFAGNNGAAIAGAIALGVLAASQHHAGYGRPYCPPRVQYYAPPPPRVVVVVPQQPICGFWTTHGWQPGPCLTYRAFNGHVRQPAYGWPQVMTYGRW